MSETLGSSEYPPAEAENAQKYERVSQEIARVQSNFNENLISYEAHSEKMPTSIFLDYERQCADAYDDLRNLKHSRPISPETAAKAVSSISRGAWEIGNTMNCIETQSAHFFTERIGEIRRALESHEDSEGLSLLEELPIANDEHNAIKYMNSKAIREKYGDDQFAWDREDTIAHSRLVDVFNQINDKARDYNVTPLTFRNFENHRFGVPFANRDEQDRMSRDRHIVEDYLTIALVNRPPSRFRKDSPRSAVMEKYRNQGNCESEGTLMLQGADSERASLLIGFQADNLRDDELTFAKMSDADKAKKIKSISKYCRIAQGAINSVAKSYNAHPSYVTDKSTSFLKAFSEVNPDNAGIQPEDSIEANEAMLFNERMEAIDGIDDDPTRNAARYMRNSIKNEFGNYNSLLSLSDEEKRTKFGNNEKLISKNVDECLRNIIMNLNAIGEIATENHLEPPIFRKLKYADSTARGYMLKERTKIDKDIALAFCAKLYGKDFMGQADKEKAAQMAEINDVIKAARNASKNGSNIFNEYY